MTSRVRVSFRDSFNALAISGRDGPTSDISAQDGANLPQQPAGTASDDGALSLGVGANFAAPLTSAPTMRTG